MKHIKKKLTAILAVIVLVGTISSCGKKADENADWASDIVGAYTGKDNKNQDISVTVSRNSDKSIKISYYREPGFSYYGIQFTDSDVILTDPAHCSFSSEHDCDSFSAGPDRIYGCSWYAGSATFSNNSVSIAFSDTTTYNGTFVMARPLTAVASK